MTEMKTSRKRQKAMVHRRPGGYSVISLRRVSEFFSAENLFFFPLHFALCVSLRRRNTEHLLALCDDGKQGEMYQIRQ